MSNGQSENIKVVSMKMSCATISEFKISSDQLFFGISVDICEMAKEDFREMCKICPDDLLTITIQREKLVGES